MRLDGVDAEGKNIRNLVVRLPFGDHLEHFALPCHQQVDGIANDNHHVRLQLPGKLDGLTAVASFPYDFHVSLRGNDHTEPAAYDGMVVS